MIKMIFLAGALCCCAVTANSAQLYRWVDDKGNVEWRDTPPPASAKKVEQRRIGGSTIETSSLPFSVQQAMKTYPVTLWSFDCGDPCTKARAHLARRGIPYTERNVAAEHEAFQKLTGGSMEAPLLVVGNTRLKGYLESDWDNALDAAGYPRTAPPGSKPAAKPPVAAAAKPTASEPPKPAAELPGPADPSAPRP